MSTPNKTFVKKNKNAIEERQRLQSRSQAIDALPALRTKMPSVNAATIRAAREKGSP